MKFWPIMHAFREMKEYLLNAKSFWESQDIDEDDPDLSRIISKIKLDNPRLQPRAMTIDASIYASKYKGTK